jgi:hypothetical protein
MKQIILIAISFNVWLINFSFGQTIEKKDSNPYFDIVNIDQTGKVTPVELLVNIKVNLESRYEALYIHDFDKNGKDEEIFYSFGSQSFARFLMKPDGNMETINLYNDMFDIPQANEGFWFYISDIFGDTTPEILIFSKIGSSCFVKIINYSSSKSRLIEHTYNLYDMAFSKQLIIVNQKKINMPYGSQGLFDETPLIIE